MYSEATCKHQEANQKSGVDKKYCSDLTVNTAAAASVHSSSTFYIHFLSMQNLTGKKHQVLGRLLTPLLKPWTNGRALPWAVQHHTARKAQKFSFKHLQPHTDKAYCGVVPPQPTSMSQRNTLFLKAGQRYLAAGRLYHFIEFARASLAVPVALFTVSLLPSEEPSP